MQQRLSCGAPFSFFFDVVQIHWKSTEDPVALHRICTLARKQGATHIVVENASGRADVIEDVDALDSRYGGGGAAECLTISFFSGGDPATPIDAIDAAAFLGQVCLVNYREPGKSAFSITYVFEAILRTPALPGASGQLLNNYVCVGPPFDIRVLGRVFSLSGIYYCQQNSETHVCAHASIRMALNSGGARPTISNEQINRHLGVQPPCGGLTLGQIVDVVENLGGKAADVFNCDQMKATDYMKILASIVESGDRALLVFTTGTTNVEHVVCVYGHTRNSDEWHPQAIQAYAGPQSAQFYSGSMWIDHFLIHDDNLGPYYTLGGPALETNDDVKAHWIIAVRDRLAAVDPDVAETLSSVYLTNLLPLMAPLAAKARWLAYLAQQSHTLVLRAVLVERQSYVDHLMASNCHDGSTCTATDVGQIPLPDYFWMVEFSLPALYTGNHSKLGEVIIHPNPPTAAPTDDDYIIAIRVPGYVIARPAPGAGFVVIDFPMTAHSRVYRANGPDQEW
jgi:hypothetical protein